MCVLHKSELLFPKWLHVLEAHVGGVTVRNHPALCVSVLGPHLQKVLPLQGPGYLAFSSWEQGVVLELNIVLGESAFGTPHSGQGVPLSLHHSGNVCRESPSELEGLGQPRRSWKDWIGMKIYPPEPGACFSTASSPSTSLPHSPHLRPTPPSCASAT